jgi:hypothetical protein
LAVTKEHPFPQALAAVRRGVWIGNNLLNFIGKHPRPVEDKLSNRERGIK